MRIVIQRVKEASVSISGKVKSAIETGLMILVGVEPSDTQEDVDWLVKKTVNLRIFNDNEGVMNRSVIDVGGDLLVVSQFTLHASTKKGNRPSYIRAARPEHAIPLYRAYIDALNSLMPRKCGEGVFGADMQVSLINDGPVTIIIDSKLKE